MVMVTVYALLFKEECIMAQARQLKSGTWRIEVYVGTDKNGKKIRKNFTAPTRWQAEKMADEFIKSGKNKIPDFTVREAVAGYIDLRRNILSPATIHGYEIIIRNRLQSLMALDVHDVNSLTMQRAINEDAVNVGAKTINEAKNLVVTALRLYGVKPELQVTLPAKKPVIKELPTPELVIEAVMGTDIELACLLAIWLSLRISEVRGLQFRDIRNGHITVRRSNLSFSGKDHIREVNKTFKSTRTLELPDYLMKKIQAIPHSSEEDFIVPMSYQNLARRFKKLLKSKGYEMRFHDLRHMNASVMMMLGVPDKYAMERGGWSTDNVLKSVYQHTFSEKRKQIDKTIDDYFGSIIKGI